jgi:hypothetical protein
MQASRILHVLVIPKSIMDVRYLLHDIGRTGGNEISKEPRRPADASGQVLRFPNRLWSIKSLGSFYGERVMRGKSYAALTVHGLTKSFRKTHLVALDLIQAKVHTALAVLSFLLLPSVSYLYHAFNAEVQLFSEYSSSTLLHNIPASSLQKILRTARHSVRRNTTREGRTKVNKRNGKWRTTLHMFYLFKIPRQFTQRFGNIILLVSSLYDCSLS